MSEVRIDYNPDVLNQMLHDAEPWRKRLKEEIERMYMEEGIKYDKDKPRVAEMVIDFGDAMLELSRVWSFGADKYSKSNWKLVEDGETRYTNALLRHLIAEGTNQYDDESKLLHATHVAWNSLARLWFILQKKESGYTAIEKPKEVLM